MALSVEINRYNKYPHETISLIIFTALIIAGCAGQSGDIDPYTQKLLWLDAADPQTDAQQALKKGDFRLLGLAARSVNIPGLKYAGALPNTDGAYTIMVRKGSTELVNAINEILAAMDRDGTLAILRTRWFNTETST